MHKNFAKPILVTGANGFVGRNLVSYLRELKYPVTAIDKEINVLSINRQEMFNRYLIDTVVHLAAEVGRLRGEEEPEAMIENNVLGTLAVIKFCLKHNCKLVNFSTSEAKYPTNVYGLSKLFAEKLVEHYVKNYGLKAVTIRPFMLYGSGHYPNKYQSALDRFVYAALTGGVLEVHKGAIRSWCHISDFVRGVELVIKKHNFNNYDIYDIGASGYLKMADIAFAITRLVGRGKIKEVKSPGFLTLNKRADFRKINSLGFKPQIKLSQGLQELIKWHQSIL